MTSFKKPPAAIHSSASRLGACESILTHCPSFFTQISEYFVFLFAPAAAGSTRTFAPGSRSSPSLPVFFTWQTSSFPPIQICARNRLGRFKKTASCRLLYLIFLFSVILSLHFGIPVRKSPAPPRTASAPFCKYEESPNNSCPILPAAEPDFPAAENGHPSAGCCPHRRQCGSLFPPPGAPCWQPAQQPGFRIRRPLCRR